MTLPATKTRVPDTMARWSSRLLAPALPLPEPVHGLALVWPAQDVLLLHNDRAVALRTDDLALVDRTLPLTIKGDSAWTAQLLDLQSRDFVFRPNRRPLDVAAALDGTDPLAGSIRRLWTLGQDVDRMGLADELVVVRILDLIANFAHKLAVTDRDGSTSSHRGAMIARAELLIAAHLSEPDFSPETLAQQMRISPRHVSSLFAAIGTTTTKAILAQRLARAKTLLADPLERNQQIASIARACGFADQSYFARCFHRDAGMTPRQFRQQSFVQDYSERS